MGSGSERFFDSTGDIFESLKCCIEKKDGVAVVTDEPSLREDCIDVLVYNAAINPDAEIKAGARAVIRELAKDLGIRLASIQNLYEAMGSGKAGGFTVPAINIRGLTYYTARAVFRAAKKNDAMAFIFEIAKSEIAYTEQEPDEYAITILASAIKEGHRGSVFIQGDHFQINAKNYGTDSEKEVSSVKNLISKALKAGFYNIDIDASTVVDLSKPNITEEQRPNFEITAELTKFIRANEPEGITVSIGGEIGEVGKKNSTEEELRAFMDGYLELIDNGVTGISKVSVQTGTSHGGVVLPDGSIAKVAVDFDTIEQLTKVSKDSYGLSGVVQHGASTLPDDAFHVFPERGASEVHLATGFQNMLYDSEAFPKELKDEVYAYLKENMKADWADGLTEEQFIYKTRKKGFGPFKKKMWDISEDSKAKIGQELEDRFDMLFKSLKAVNNSGLVNGLVK
ncbi:MAG: class II fructose-bisphosphate aldolase [Deltaproteobacteria bacterium]|nr:class II fructose-bisphosphate aldolase [Deltaproteobacteria bacterium]